MPRHMPSLTALSCPAFWLNPPQARGLRALLPVNVPGSSEVTSSLPERAHPLYPLYRRGTDKPAPFTPSFLPEPNTWAGPFIMEGCNAKIVHLSNALVPKVKQMARTWGMPGI